MPSFLGLGKTIFNSGVSYIPEGNFRNLEIILTERVTRNKNSGAWPVVPLTKILEGKSRNLEVRESRDVQTVQEFEEYCNSRFPLKETLAKLRLEDFSWFQRQQLTLNHHLAHAYSAAILSPFERCAIAVLDGAGSPAPEGFEYYTLYRWNRGELELLEKETLSFHSRPELKRSFTEGIGLFYEEISDFIFGKKTEAGKVMGLAPFGKSLGLQSSYVDFLDGLPWEKRFQGKGKREWETSPHMNFYQDLAATVQENFEHATLMKLKRARELSGETNLIFTGGCALNCTFNGKFSRLGVFERIYIPPNPGDEGISLGCAAASYFQQNPSHDPLAWDELSSYWGDQTVTPEESEIRTAFENFTVEKPVSLVSAVAKLLSAGEVVAWFQGRSECGPRALGHRSIFASPLKKDLKTYLNAHIKFRESFRPYGCTVPWELAHEYFDVTPGFENPFMSFAVPTKPEQLERLSDVTHVDGTSRMQTLHQKQNPTFHALLLEVGKLTGLPILLNTSLNVMNEPILETLEDAKRFFEYSEIEVMVVENYLICKRTNRV